MNNHEMRSDVWSRVLLALALVLLLINQAQIGTRLPGDATTLIPNASGAFRDIPRYPQPAPAWERFRQGQVEQPVSVTARQGSWVF